MFGASRPSFGNNGASPFGQQQQTGTFGQPQSTAGVFGSNATNNAQSGFGGFGNNQQQAAPSPFGMSQQQTSSGPFGQTTSSVSNPPSLFNNTASAQVVAGGTSIKPFTAYTEKDATTGVTNVFQSISCMPEYKDYSFEELRFQDYQANNKYGQGGNDASGTVASAFGVQQNSSPFGTNNQATFGAGTGNTASTGGLFGQPAGTANSPFGQSNATNTYGQVNNTPFGQSNTGTFGASNTVNTTSPFGQTTTANSPFGVNKAATGGAASTGGLFGQNNTGTAFGQTGTSAGGGLFSRTNNANASPFGQPNTFNQAGTSSAGALFGQNNNTQQQPNSIFGQNNNQTPSGLFSQGGTQQPGGFFGSNTNNAPGTFGQGASSNNIFNKPATANGLFGQSATQQQQPDTGLFGQNNNTVNNNTFGQNARPTGGVFGQGQSQQGGLFGQNNQQVGLFGQNNQQQQQPGTTGGGLFGQNTQQGGLFGQNTVNNTFRQNNNNTIGGGGGLFGAKPNTTGGMFGSGTVGGSTFGQNAQQGSTGLFGQNNNQQQQQQQTGGLFGANNNNQQSRGLFGQQTNTQQPGGLFGANNNNNQPQSGGLFGQNNVAQQPGGVFGSKPAITSGGGLFGNNNTGTGSGGLFNNQQTGAQGGNLFGNNMSQTDNNAAGNNIFSKPANTGTDGLFGGQNNTQINNAPNTLFGSNNTQNANTASTGTGLFDQKQPGTTTGLGGGFFAPKPAGTSTTSSTGGGLFGAKPTGTTSSGWFGSKPEASNSGGLFNNQNSSTTGSGIPGLQPSVMGSDSGTQQSNNPYGTNELFSRVIMPNSFTQPCKPTATKITADNKKKSSLTSAYKLAPKPLFTAKVKPVSGVNRTGSVLVSRNISSISSQDSVRELVPTSTGSSSAFTSDADELILASNKLFNPDKKSFKNLILNRKKMEDATSTVGEDEEPERITFIPESSGEEAQMSKEVSFFDGIIDTPVSKDKKKPAGAILPATAPVPTPSKSAAERKDNPKPLGVLSHDISFTDDGYYISPSLETLASMSLLQLRKVSNLIVGHKDHGRIEFLAPVDLSNISLPTIGGSLVRFSERVCEVSYTGNTAPPPGEQLNVPARITLYNTFPTDKATRNPIKDPKHPILKRHIERLKKIEQTKFESYDVKNGSYTFSVENPVA